MLYEVITPIGGVHATMSALPDGEFTEGLRLQARELGAELVRAWRERRVDPEVALRMDDFRARMRELISWRREEWPYEYVFWRRERGLE